MRLAERDAVLFRVDGGLTPKVIRLHFVRDEMLAAWVPPESFN